MPPLEPASRLTAIVLFTTAALAAGVCTVVRAAIRPALLISLRLPDWSRMAVAVWLKGEDAGALMEVGEIVLVLLEMAAARVAKLLRISPYSAIRNGGRRFQPA